MKMDIIRFLRFCSRGRCGTVSNALLKSKNTVQMSNPELSSLYQLSIAASKAPVVDKVYHCWVERGLNSSKSSTSRFLTCFSRSLLNTESNEIGWYSFWDQTCMLCDFGTGETWTFLHSSEISSLSEMKL